MKTDTVQTFPERQRPHHSRLGHGERHCRIPPFYRQESTFRCVAREKKRLGAARSTPAIGCESKFSSSPLVELNREQRRPCLFSFSSGQRHLTDCQSVFFRRWPQPVAFFPLFSPAVSVGDQTQRRQNERDCCYQIKTVYDHYISIIPYRNRTTRPFSYFLTPFLVLLLLLLLKRCSHPHRLLHRHPHRLGTAVRVVHPLLVVLAERDASPCKPFVGPVCIGPW